MMAGWIRRWRMGRRGIVRTPEGQNVNDITTSTRTDAVPDGWPPPTPVELLRVSNKLWWLAVTAAILNAAALGWYACEQRIDRRDAAETRDQIVKLLAAALEKAHANTDR